MAAVVVGNTADFFCGYGTFDLPLDPVEIDLLPSPAGSSVVVWARQAKHETAGTLIGYRIQHMTHTTGLGLCFDVIAGDRLACPRWSPNAFGDGSNFWACSSDLVAGYDLELWPIQAITGEELNGDWLVPGF